jgi:hypothetical protein
MNREEAEKVVAEAIAIEYTIRQLFDEVVEGLASGLSALDDEEFAVEMGKVGIRWDVEREREHKGKGYWYTGTFRAPRSGEPYLNRFGKIGIGEDRETTLRAILVEVKDE